MSIMPIRVWPQADQLDEDGNLIPVFGLPPPLPPPRPIVGICYAYRIIMMDNLQAHGYW
jgi:hypothetical protein